MILAMRPTRFSKVEAEALVGKRIRTLDEFSGVPKGTTGAVIRADIAGTAEVGGAMVEEFDVAIQWDLPFGEPFVSIRGGKALVDWYTKDEYERYLAEIV